MTDSSNKTEILIRALREILDRTNKKGCRLIDVRKIASGALVDLELESMADDLEVALAGFRVDIHQKLV